MLLALVPMALEDANPTLRDSNNLRVASDNDAWVLVKSGVGGESNRNDRMDCPAGVDGTSAPLGVASICMLSSFKLPITGTTDDSFTASSAVSSLSSSIMLSRDSFCC
jgi:hypothetical protein